MLVTTQSFSNEVFSIQQKQIKQLTWNIYVSITYLCYIISCKKTNVRVGRKSSLDNSMGISKIKILSMIYSVDSTLLKRNKEVQFLIIVCFCQFTTYQMQFD